MMIWDDASERVKESACFIWVKTKESNKRKKNTPIWLRSKTDLNPNTKCGSILLEHCGCLGRRGCKNKLLFLNFKILQVLRKNT
jgi:hypothetical protein